jgi:mxaJ protein
MCSRFLVSAISGLGLFILSDANAGEPFRICAEPDNLPFAQREGEKGLEIDVAKLLARDLGRPFEVRWVAQRDYSFYRTTIGAGACGTPMTGNHEAMVQDRLRLPLEAVVRRG